MKTIRVVKNKLLNNGVTRCASVAFTQRRATHAEPQVIKMVTSSADSTDQLRAALVDDIYRLRRTNKELDQKYPALLNYGK